LETVLTRKKPEALQFEAADVIARVKSHGDLFKDVLKLKQKLPRLNAKRELIP
jgi:hypothetical protein